MKNKILLIFFVIFFSACISIENFNNKAQENKILNVLNESLPSQNQTIKSFSNISDLSQEVINLKKFNNPEELVKWVQSSYLYKSQESIDSSGAPAPKINEFLKYITTSSPSTPQQKDQYSKTNIQVAGIDEPDFVKTDGSYIYLLKDKRLIIVDAKASVPSVIFDKDLGLENAPTNLFIDKDFLIVFSTSYKKVFSLDYFDISPRELYKPYTTILVLNISNKKSPAFWSNFSLYGNYIDARLKDNIVYVVASTDIYDSFSLDETPDIVYQNQKIPLEVYYLPKPAQSYSLWSVASFYSNGSLIDSKAFLLERGSSTIYVSNNALYVAAAKSQGFICTRWFCPPYDYEINKTDRFEKAILPYLPSKIKTQIQDILNQNIPDSKKWDKIQPILSNYILSYNEKNLSKTEAEEFEQTIKNITLALADYDFKIKLNNSKTFIYKFSIADGKINLLNSAYVNGFLLNQWSLDEYNDSLRVLSTIDLSSRPWFIIPLLGQENSLDTLNKFLPQQQAILFNRLTIFDKNLKLVSVLDGIAPDEKIYSVRFLEDKVYFVTYKKIDPFFVVDLANPASPQILGYVKLPGYSTYLHPINSTHMLGIGLDTKVSDYGFEQQAGLKISLFDVSNASNPVVLDSLVLGDSGSTSPVLYDHKAFVFDPDKKVLYLPATIVSLEKSLIYKPSQNWYGIYILGFEKNKISVLDKLKVKATYDIIDFNEWDYIINRVIYISNMLFSISNGYIFVHDLDSLKEITTIKI